MRIHYVESRVFTLRVKEFMDDDGYRTLQALLQEDPERGDVMQGCAGLRKLRWSQPTRGKGKRGGCRIIYLNLPEFRRIDLLAVYGKDEQDDLNEAQRAQLRALAETVRRDAAFWAKRKRNPR